MNKGNRIIALVVLGVVLLLVLSITLMPIWGEDENQIDIDVPRLESDSNFSIEDMTGLINNDYNQNQNPIKRVDLNKLKEKIQTNLSQEDSTVYDNEEDEKIKLLEDKIKEIEKKNNSVFKPKTKVKKPVKKAVKKAVKKVDTVKKVLTIEEQLYNIRNSKKSNIKTINGKKEYRIKAVVNKNQTIYENSTLTIRILDDYIIGRDTLKRNTYLYGLTKFTNENRVDVVFSNVLNNRIKLYAYDFDGRKGLIVTDPEVLSLIKKATEDELYTGLKDYGKIAKTLSSIFSKQTDKIKIDLYDEHELQLRGTFLY